MGRFLFGFMLIAAFVAPANAEGTTFASFMSVNSVQELNFVGDPNGYGGNLFTGGTGSTAAHPGLNNTTFSFQDYTGQLASSFLMSAVTSDQGILLTPTTIAQTGFNGFFEFRYTGASDFTVNGMTYGTNALLLRGEFTDAALTGNQGAASGAVFGSTEAGGLINYSSDVFGFGTDDRGFSLALTSITPALNMTNGDLASFKGYPTGSFFAETVSSAPEPMTWVMMFAGFGLIGATLRRRPGTSSAFAHI